MKIGCRIIFSLFPKKHTPPQSLSWALVNWVPGSQSSPVKSCTGPVWAGPCKSHTGSKRDMPGLNRAWYGYMPIQIPVQAHSGQTQSSMCFWSEFSPWDQKSGFRPMGVSIWAKGSGTLSTPKRPLKSHILSMWNNYLRPYPTLIWKDFPNRTTFSTLITGGRERGSESYDRNYQK